MTNLALSSPVRSLGGRIALALATLTIVAQTSPAQGTAADYARAANAAERIDRAVTGIAESPAYGNEGRPPSRRFRA